MNCLHAENSPKVWVSTARLLSQASCSLFNLYTQHVQVAHIAGSPRVWWSTRLLHLIMLQYKLCPQDELTVCCRFTKLCDQAPGYFTSFCCNLNYAHKMSWLCAADSPRAWSKAKLLWHMQRHSLGSTMNASMTLWAATWGSWTEWPRFCASKELKGKLPISGCSSTTEYYYFLLIVFYLFFIIYYLLFIVKHIKEQLTYHALCRHWRYMVRTLHAAYNSLNSAQVLRLKALPI